MTGCLALLGPGHVGRAVVRAWLEGSEERRCLVVSRSGTRVQSLVDRAERITSRAFSFGSQPNQVGPSQDGLQGLLAELGPGDALLATFPVCGQSPAENGRSAAPFTSPEGHPFMEQMLRLFSELKDRGVRVSLLTSSSGYQNEDGLLLEDGPWRSEDWRFGFEEWLRLRLGVNVLVLPGLFGGEREPKNWLAKGWVRNWSGTVNLLHHEDAASLCVPVLASAHQGERINLSSGKLHSWAQIALATGVCPPDASQAALAELLQRQHDQGVDPASKRLSPQKLLRLFPELQKHTFRWYPEGSEVF